MAYLKKVTDATKDTGVGNGWWVFPTFYVWHAYEDRVEVDTNKLISRFKIQEAGFSNGVWGTDTVINSGGNQQIHIPECIEDGQYLLRAEMVALHGARSINGAQLYVSFAISPHD